MTQISQRSMQFFRNLSCYLLVLVFHFNLLSAQTSLEQNRRYDSIFYDTAVRISAQDIGRAAEIADSLYQNSSADLHKLKALMLSADLLEKQNKREQAIAYVLRAESIANTIGNFQWQARIYGFLSTQYRIIGLIDQGKRYLEKGLKISDKITPKSASDQYKGMVYQEMAHYAMHGHDYKEAIRLLNKVALFFSDINDVRLRTFFFGNNEEMLGRSYLGLKKYDAATQHYNKALKFLKDADAGESQWAGMTYHGLGKIALENDRLQKSLQYLKKAETIADHVAHVSLQELVYRDLGNYYKITGDLDNYLHYNTKYLNSLNQHLKSTRVASNGAINRMYDDKLANSSVLNVIITVVIVLLIFSLLLYYFTRRRRKRQEQMYKATIAKLQSRKEEAKPVEVSMDKAKGNRFMPEETELALLRKLEEFETNNEFTNPNLSLSSLSVDLNTNTKYLSYIINTRKNKDFNNYVNDLRVYYIINVIQNNPVYLNYKISYMSKESGFSSHSKFTNIFKNTTGLTPSAFLKQVKMSNEEQNRSPESVS